MAEATRIHEGLVQTQRRLDNSPQSRGAASCNLACFYSLTSQRDRALPALADELKFKPGLIEWSKKDTDLDSLRGDRAFQALYDTIESARRAVISSVRNREGEPAMEALPESKAELVEQVQQAATALEETLDQLSKQQMTGLRDPAGWSVQNHLDHLAVWEEFATMLLERRPRAERLAAMDVDLATVRNSSEDELNAILRERTPPRTAAQSRAALRAAHEHLLRALQAVQDANLQTSYAEWVPEGEYKSDRPVMEWVVGNSSLHYREHLPWIEAIAAQGSRA